jgi:hypothetical protein
LNDDDHSTECGAQVSTAAIHSRKASSMQIYMFTSEANANLHAFAGDSSGSQLPEHHGPWGAAGSLASDQHPPHGFSRARIEQAIKIVGFQLWRLKPISAKPRREKQAKAA